jgi:hypothetical protein
MFQLIEIQRDSRKKIIKNFQYLLIGSSNRYSFEMKKKSEFLVKYNLKYHSIHATIFFRKK